VLPGANHPDERSGMAESPTTLLTEWLRRQVPEPAFAWLVAQLDRLRGEAADRDLHVTLGMIPRRLGKADLDLSADDLAAADRARPGWDPRQWTVDEAARVLALLAVATDDDRFAQRFAELCRSADVAEAVALYRGLPLYPGPARLEAQAAEGLRTHMRAVFEAVAHRSPYPRERFGEERWNQMVLKALFVGSPLHPIQGIDERANPVLARILGDYAHERWAAGRPVSPELWRCVGPFADGPLLDDLERAAGGAPPERAAAALALAASPAPRARGLLDRLLPDEAASLRDGRLSWQTLAQAL
jgi:hypothetical protein